MKSKPESLQSAQRGPSAQYSPREGWRPITRLLKQQPPRLLLRTSSLPSPIIILFRNGSCMFSSTLSCQVSVLKWCAVQPGPYRYGYSWFIRPVRPVCPLHDPRVALTHRATRGLGLGTRRVGRPNPTAYDEYFRAYSVAMLPGRQRDNVSYGGKSAHLELVLCVPQLRFHSNYASVRPRQPHAIGSRITVDVQASQPRQSRGVDSCRGTRIHRTRGLCTLASMDDEDFAFE